jgi:predicted transcriptional regulator
MAHRVNVALDPEYAAKLSRLAERMHVPEGALAK